jgi:uncharacterized protein YbbC (DUF1343 family)
MSVHVKTGADVLVAESFARLRGRRVGLVCNHTTVESEGLAHLADLLHARDDVDLVALFGPEHGVRGEAQDMDVVGAGRDPRTGLSVHSLYGATFDSLTPTAESLRDLDVLVFDVQDVGSRYYTFAATMALCMKAAAASGVEVMILDRPNPLGGEAVEGPGITAGYESFVGLYDIPVRHGMTVGELARYYDAVEGIGAKPTVVPMTGWRRSMTFEETGLAWVHPSPNMPTVDTAFIYPGMCLVEGTRLSEGRGTTRPFEQCGAPFIDPDRLAARLCDLAAQWDLPGVTFRPCTFRPTFHKHAHEACGGAFLHVRDRTALRPWAVGVAYLEAIRDLWPTDLKWRTETYEYVSDRLAIDLLFGSTAFRERWASSGSARDLVEAAAEAAEAFARRRAPYLLYD